MERRPFTVSKAAGSASQKYKRPAGAIGFHATAASAYTVSIDGGDAFPFAAGAITFYYPAADISEVVLAHNDGNPSDVGASSVCWILGKVGS